MLLIAVVVLIVLGYRRLSRDRANLRVSRDRANMDLQMMSHQIQIRVQTQVEYSPPSRTQQFRENSCERMSLPPGPPSSSAGQSMAEQEVMPTPWAMPATLAGWGSSAANSGVASTSLAAPTWPLPSLRRPNFSAPPKRPTQSESVSAPRAKRAFTSDSPPALRPLGGAPPVAASGSSVVPPPGLHRLAESAGARISGAALTAPASGLEEGSELSSEPTEAELAAFMADKEVVLELESMQGILGPLLSQASPETVAPGVRVARQRVVAHPVQGVVESTPPTPPEATPLDPEWLKEMFNELDEGLNDGGAGSEPQEPQEPQEPHLPVSPQGSLDPEQDSMAPRQRALHVARQHLKIVHTDAEREHVLHTLAKALGASRIEGGTIKALHAVLLTLERPEMSDKQAYTSTGGSLSQTLRSGEGRCSTPSSTYLHHEGLPRATISCRANTIGAYVVPG